MGGDVLHRLAVVPGARAGVGAGQDRDDPRRSLRDRGRRLPGHRAAQPARGGPIHRSIPAARRAVRDARLLQGPQVPGPGRSRGRPGGRHLPRRDGGGGVGGGPARHERRPVRPVGPDLRAGLLLLRLHSPGAPFRARLAHRRGRGCRGDPGRVPQRDRSPARRAGAVDGRGAEVAGHPGRGAVPAHRGRTLAGALRAAVLAHGYGVRRRLHRRSRQPPGPYDPGRGRFGDRRVPGRGRLPLPRLPLDGVAGGRLAGPGVPRGDGGAGGRAAAARGAERAGARAGVPGHQHRVHAPGLRAGRSGVEGPPGPRRDRRGDGRRQQRARSATSGCGTRARCSRATTRSSSSACTTTSWPCTPTATRWTANCGR